LIGFLVHRGYKRTRSHLSVISQPKKIPAARAEEKSESMLIFDPLFIGWENKPPKTSSVTSRRQSSKESGCPGNGRRHDLQQRSDVV
jgi:hypothetical protein